MAVGAVIGLAGAVGGLVGSLGGAAEAGASTVAEAGANTAEAGANTAAELNAGATGASDAMGTGAMAADAVAPIPVTSAPVDPMPVTPAVDASAPASTITPSNPVANTDVINAGTNPALSNSLGSNDAALNANATNGLSTPPPSALSANAPTQPPPNSYDFGTGPDGSTNASSAYNTSGNTSSLLSNNQPVGLSPPITGAGAFDKLSDMFNGLGKFVAGNKELSAMILSGFQSAADPSQRNLRDAQAAQFQSQTANANFIRANSMTTPVVNWGNAANPGMMQQPSAPK